jgi:hypothetical protein
LRVCFLLESKLVAQKQGRYAQKASACPFWISNCGFRILGFSFSIRIPQSTIRNLGGPPGLRNEVRLMVFERNALASGPGTG